MREVCNITKIEQRKLKKLAEASANIAKNLRDISNNLRTFFYVKARYGAIFTISKQVIASKFDDKNTRTIGKFFQIIVKISKQLQPFCFLR